MQSKRLLPLFGFLALALAFPAHAVVVVGGDNGWEVSFDGNVNGFYVYEDADDAPGQVRRRALDSNEPRVSGRDSMNMPIADANMLVLRNDAGVPLDYATITLMPAAGEDPEMLTATEGAASRVRGTGMGRAITTALELGNNPVATARAGGTIAGTESTRIRTGLLPAFFSFNVRSPEVNGLRGSARISFAPQIQTANTKNNFGNGTQAGAQIDLREVFFNIDGDFGTVSVGRTLSLFQRQNILTDMTLFGVGAQGGQGGGGTTLGRIGHGYVYPQFNARISYKTPSVSGFQFEVGVFDPSRIATDDGGVDGASWTETSVPRLEAEATYVTDYNGGSVKAWFGGLWQEAESTAATRAVGVADKVTATGIHGGLQLGFQGLEIMFSGYTGEGLGTTLMLDTNSVDACGNERDNFGYIGQVTYTFNGRTKFGVSYGESTADETDTDRDRRAFGRSNGCNGADRLSASTTAPTTIAGTAIDPTVQSYVAIDSQSAFTAGIYHDVNAWLKVMAEYTRTENDWHDDASQEADTIAVGSFFLW